MAKFNTATIDSTKAVNLAGGEAYQESVRLEFASILLASFLKAKFYASPDETAARIIKLMDEVPPMFAAQAAIYARDQFNMRSVTHLVAAEIAGRVKGERWTRAFYNKVVVRPDDMTEIVACYLSKHGKRPLPNSLKDGIARAFGKFSAYQLAKYRATDKTVSLIDLVNLCHPKPNERNAEALALLVKGDLKSTETWESMLTKAGQDAAESDEDKEERKAEAWAELIDSGKIGYFALLRNLRNIMKQAPDSLPMALTLLMDEQRIKHSRVLPFRFLTAAKSIEGEEGARSVIAALAVATDIAVSNCPSMDGKTLVVIDHSGSMEGRPIEIASLFGAMLYKRNDADLMLFSSDAKWLTPNPADSATGIAKQIQDGMASSGTNFHVIFKTAKRVYARIIILSDMQAWQGGRETPSKDLSEYRTRSGANPKVFSFDLAGHGTLQFPERNVCALAGFSDKALDLIALLERDKDAFLKEIEAISFE